MKSHLPFLSCLAVVTLFVSQSCSDDEIDPPVADFTYTSDNDFHTPSVITFQNQSELAEDYLWDFGDGTATSTEVDPVHTYETSGTYTVKLTARSGSLTNEKTASIVISPFEPVADFTFTSDNDFHAPSTITFANASTHAASFTWDFGDGSAVSVEENPVHTYLEAGTYTVKLTATNENLSSEKTATIEVKPALPEASFTYVSDNDFVAPSEVTFTNNSVNATGASWDFGDGSEPSTDENPVHRYETAGTYTVSLTASNGTFTHTVTETIEIKEKPYTGTYKLVSVTLSEDLTIDGTTYEAGTDVTDVAQGLFMVVTCSTPDNIGMDLRPNGDLYFVCSGSTEAVQGGTWNGNATEKQLNLNFSAPPYASPFSVMITNIDVGGQVLSGEMNDLSLPGIIIGFPTVESIVVDCTIVLEKW